MRPLSLTLPLLLLLWACDCGKPPPAPALAMLTQVQGDVSVLRAAERRAARVDEPLAAGETLVTGPGSAARVRYVNGAEVRVSENSRFRVSGAPGSLTLELEEGRVISTAPKSAATGLTVVGRFGRAELVTAAEMVFDLREESPRLTLEYGEIRVLDPEGKPVQMVQGEELDFSLRKPAPPLVQAEEIVFFLEPRGGKARVRGAQQADFTEVSPEQPRELKPGSAFEVPTQATARLRSKELQMRLSGDSAGTLTEASLQGDQRTYALRLSRGRAQLQFASGQHRFKLTDAGGDIEFKVSEPSTISVGEGPSRTTVTVLAGQAELVADGKSTVLKAGEAASRSGAELQASAGPAPALLLPPDAQARVSADTLDTVGIRVPSPASGPLQVEVATEPAFREPLLTGRAGADWVRVEPPARGELHWRFLAEDGAVRARGQAHFQPDRGRSSLTERSPRAEVQETGLKATIYFQGAVPSLRFRYDAREGARSYRIRVYRANNPQKPLIDRTAERTQHTLEPGALGEGHYLWYVAALDSGGRELTGGRMNKLELVYDNARRELAIRRPRPQERPGRDGVPVEGVAPIGSRLFVNDVPVALDAKGRFSQRVPPADVLVFRLDSKQGAAYWVRTLRSSR